MPGLCTWIWVLFPATILELTYCSVITGSPGALKKEAGDNVEFRWTVDSSFDPSVSGNNVFVYEGYPDSPTSSAFILAYYGHFTPSCDNKGATDILCIAEGQQMGFSITNIQDSRASRYTLRIQVTDSTGSTPVQHFNSNAILYIYKAPSVPTIINNVPVSVGSTLTLTCDSSSRSLPTDFRNLSQIEYTWSGAAAGSSKQISIGPVTKDNHGASETCTARDQGARDSSQSSVTLNVQFPPGSVDLTASKTTVVEGMDDLTLTCTVQTAGNPTSYTYYWTLPDNNPQEGPSNTLTILKTKLKASQHDGTWRCESGNVAGRSSSDSLAVTVNAGPTVTIQPTSTTILINQTLTLTCSFKAKPASITRWVYGESGSPDTTTLQITPTSSTDGPYTVTTSTIRWLSAEYGKRKTVSGQYRCEATNTPDSSPATGVSDTVTLDVEYGPLSVTFDGPENVDIIENTDSVSRVCEADCNPSCSFTWTNGTSGGVISNTATLDLGQPDRYDDNTYTCTATNAHGKTTKQFSVNVRFAPDLTVTFSNQMTLVAGSDMTMTCTAAWNPPSTINLYNVTANNSPLDTVDTGNQAQYMFTNLHCLDTGDYRFTANNGVPDGSNTVEEIIHVEVMCAPSVSSKVPNSGSDGKQIGDNFNMEVGIISNPHITITPDNWSFKQNGTDKPFPSNAVSSYEHNVQRMTNAAKLMVTGIVQENYGTYTLTASGNAYGNMEPVAFQLQPEGPPSPPSTPMLVNNTAVSLTLNWTSGFNGGLSQTFTVLYQASGSDTEIPDNVITDPGVSTGHIVVHKLQDLVENTKYAVRVQAENAFATRSVVYGPSAEFTTIVKAVFTSDPTIKLDGEEAEIHFIISGHLTHIDVENCVQGTTTCTKERVPVPVNKRRRRSADEHHDFTARVTLVDASATEFLFNFWMIDGDDVLNSEAVGVPIGNSGSSNFTIIIAAVVGVVVALIVVVVFVILWKRGILPKRKEKGSTQSVLENNYRVPDNEGIVNVTMDDEKNPHGASNTHVTRAPAASLAAARAAGALVSQHEVGPLNGDVYSEVHKTHNINGAAVTTSNARPEAVYSQVHKDKKKNSPNVPPEAVYSQVNKAKKTNVETSGGESQPAHKPLKAPKPGESSRNGASRPNSMFPPPIAGPSQSSPPPEQTYAQVDKTKKKKVPTATLR